MAPHSIKLLILTKGHFPKLCEVKRVFAHLLAAGASFDAEFKKSWPCAEHLTESPILACKWGRCIKVVLNLTYFIIRKTTFIGTTPN